MIDRVNENSRTYFLLHSKPLGYPTDFPCEPMYGFPIFERLTTADIPSSMCAFDDLGRVSDPTTTLLHFHKDDEKFAPVIINPLKYGNKWGHFMSLCSPDVTLSDGMVEWERIKNTSWSRKVAATWASQGIKIVPLLRWRFVSDCAFVTAGIPKRSVIAVSSYGSVRDAELRQVLIDGLRAIVITLEPVAILVYGTALKNIQEIVGPNIQVILYPTPTEKLRQVEASTKANEASWLF